MKDFTTNDEFVKLLEELYQKKYSELYRRAYEMLGDRYAAEDAVEEVFVTIMGHQVWWTKQNENVRFEYVVRTCETVCCKILEEREKVRLIEYEEKTPENDDGRMELGVEQGVEVSGYLDKLSELDKAIFEERYFENHTVKEIAQHNNMSENNVSKHLARGKEKMSNIANGTSKYRYKAEDSKRKGTKQ